MKPFNLEEAKAGKPVVTREGLPARIICFDIKGADFPMCVLILIEDKESLFAYLTDGIFQRNAQDNDMDLFMLTEQKEGWMNISPPYPNGLEIGVPGLIYATEQEARKWRDQEAIATIKVTWGE